MPFVNITPECPRCGSNLTGRYVIANIEDGPQFLKRGEYVKICLSVPVNNLFCNDCGFEWHGTAKIKYLNMKELKTRKEDLGITPKVIHDEEISQFSRNKPKVKEKKIFKYIKTSGRLFMRVMNITVFRPFASLKDDITNMFKGR